MVKRIMSIFMVLVMLSATILPVSAVFAATNPTVTVKINGTTLSKSNVYLIDDQEQVSISASHSSGISKVYYKIGTSATQTVTGSSTTVRIPSSYTNTGEFSFYVCALSKDGTLSDWELYRLNAETESSTTEPVVTVKIDGTKLNTSNTYLIDAQEQVSISASHSNGISKIYYKIGTSTMQSVSASSTTVTIPASYTGTGEFSFNVCAVTKDGTVGQWHLYKLNSDTDSDSTEPVVTVRIDGTKLNTSNTYLIDDQEQVSISASHSSGISKLYYKIGTSTTKTVNGSSTTVTIPASYTGTGEFSFQVSALAKDGTQSDWTLYKLNADTDADSTEPVVTVKIDGTKLNTSNTYLIDNQEQVSISASHSSGISKIYYKIGTSTMQNVSGSSTTVTIPASYTGTGEFSFQVCAVTKDGTVGEWHLYKLNADTDADSTEPTITVKVSGTTLNTTNTYLIDDQEGVAISATHSSGISKLYYKIGTSTMQSVDGSSTVVTIPASYTNTGEFSFQVCAVTKDGTVGEWHLYKLSALDDDADITEPVVTVKVNGTTLNTSNTYLVDPEQVVNISATHSSGISKLYYKIGTSVMQSVVGSSTNVTIPETLTNTGEFSFQVCAVTKDGTVGEWHLYKLSALDEDADEDPIVKVKVDGDTLITNNLTKINENEILSLSATHVSGISKIYYKIGTSETETIIGSTGTVTIPEEYTNAGKFTFNVCAVANDGTIGNWQPYILEVVEGTENITYPLIIQPDERLNSDVNGLAIALRTIPTTTKSGNHNYFLLKEYVQYNIDFMNGGDEIDNKVYIYFTIPSEFSVSFVDIKGGTKIDSNTIRWTFDGLSAGEKGTIPVTLYYTGIPSDASIVKPYAEIMSNNDEDSSATINLITTSGSTEVTTNHEPFMIGDAGTDTFRPNDGINRAELAMVLVRIFDLQLVDGYTVTYKDADVMKQGQFAWATQAIMTVTKYGLMEGYDDGTFRPGTEVTKAQLITILARKFAIDGQYETHNPFEIKDEPIKLFNNLSFTYPLYGYNDHWAAQYLAQMIRLNMLPEFANTIDGNLDLVISRADTAKLICTVLLRGPSTDGTAGKTLTNSFIDVNSYTPNYEYILEASADTHNSIYQKSGWEKMVK